MHSSVFFADITDGCQASSVISIADILSGKVELDIDLDEENHDDEIVAGGSVHAGISSVRALCAQKRNIARNL